MIQRWCVPRMTIICSHGSVGHKQGCYDDEHVHSGRMELAPHREERADASQFVRKHGVLKGMKVFDDAEELLVESLCDVLDKVCKVPSRALTVPTRVPISSFCNEADFLPTAHRVRGLGRIFSGTAPSVCRSEHVLLRRQSYVSRSVQS